MGFAGIKGQSFALKFLERVLTSKKIPPAFLFYGERGVGKCKTAREFAKSLNCENPLERVFACGKCPSCVSADKGINPDITLADFEFQARLLDEEIEKQQNVKIETVRELVQMSQRKPATLWKVFIIDMAHRMQTAAASAFLKALEEPGANTLWILVSTKKTGILPTILSRCQTLPFAPLTEEIISEILTEKGERLDLISPLARIADGSLYRAEKMKDVLTRFSKLDFADPVIPFTAVKELESTGAQARETARFILEIVIAGLSPSSDTGKMEKLLECRKFIDRNVSPQRVISAVFLDPRNRQIFAAAVEKFKE